MCAEVPRYAPARTSREQESTLMDFDSLDTLKRRKFEIGIEGRVPRQAPTQQVTRIGLPDHADTKPNRKHILLGQGSGTARVRQDSKVEKGKEGTISTSPTNKRQVVAAQKSVLYNDIRSIASTRVCALSMRRSCGVVPL